MVRTSRASEHHDGGGTVNVNAGWYYIHLAAIDNSGFIGCCWVVETSWSFLFREIFAAPLFTGYQNSAITEPFPPLGNYLLNSGYSLNSPVWTMSVELQGSFLVLGLVYLRRKVPVLWSAFLVCGLVWLPIGYVALRHVSAVMRLGERTYQGFHHVIWWLAIAAVIAGILLVWPHRNDAYLPVDTGLIFLGVMSSPWCRTILSHPILVRLGDLSFTIYLLHGPIVFGPGAWIVLKMIPLIGFPASRFVGAVLVVTSVFYLSSKLVRIDLIAISLAHSVKRRQYSTLSTRLSFWSHARGIAHKREIAIKSATPN
jgi:peptidoglycan/LPS O-acetylase OafA/YrhL